MDLGSLSGVVYLAGLARRSAALALIGLGLGLVGCDAASALRGADVGMGVGAVELRGNPQNGQRLLAQYQCGSCHLIPEVPASRGVVGPPLTAFGSRSYIAGHIPNNAEALARFIVAPAELVPGTLMPSMGVSNFDARDIAAYLGTLR